MKDKILKLREEGKNYNEISAILGCSKSTISYYCSEGQKNKVLLRTQKKRAGLAGKPKQKILHTCFCGNKVRLNISKYCSHKCQKTAEKENFIQKWLKGEIKGHSGKTNVLSSFIRNYMLELNKNSCSVCGWNKLHPIDNKPLVEIDHIDGNSENSSFTNLRVLCPNCHSETPTFRRRNKVSTRNRKIPLVV